MIPTAPEMLKANRTDQRVTMVFIVVRWETQNWDDNADRHTDQPAANGEHDGFDQELHRDVSFLGAESAADPNFACPFGHGGQHDVHDADAAH